VSNSRFNREPRIFRSHGELLKTSHAIRAGIHPRTLYSMRDEGIIERQDRGVYRLLEIPGNLLVCRSADIADGTSLLDIKPYVPQFDAFAASRASWLSGSRESRRHADDSFSNEPSGLDDH